MSKDDYDIEKILSEIDREDHDNGVPGEDGRLPDELRPPDSQATGIDDLLSITGEDPGYQETEGNAPGTVQDGETGIQTPESPGDAAVVPSREPRGINQFQPEKPLATDKSQGAFTLVGTKAWNRKEPYIIALNPDLLNTDKDYLAKTFHIIDNPEKTGTLKEDLRTSLAKHMRKSGPGMLNEYRDFIAALIRTTVHELHEYFKFSEDLKNLFIYHLGPLSIHRMLIDKFTKMKFGDCFRYESQSGKGIRYLPEEFIKETVLRWFEDNINTMNLSFDSVQSYERIAKSVFQSYGIVKRNFLLRLDKLNNQLNPGKQISSKELVKLKGDKWFGTQNIVVYRRFVEKNIFH